MEATLRRRPQALQIRLHHRFDQPSNDVSGSQPSMRLRFARIADEQIDFGRAVEARIDDHVALPIEVDDGECGAHESPHAARHAGRDHVVVGPACCIIIHIART